MGSRVAISVLLVALLAGLAWFLGGDRGAVRGSHALEGGPAIAIESIARPDPAPAGRTTPTSNVPQVASAGPALDLEPSGLAPLREATPENVLRLLVVEADGRPVPDATLELLSWSGPGPEALAYDDGRRFQARAVTGVGGAAAFAQVPAGLYRLHAESADGRRTSRAIAQPEVPGPLSEVRLELPEDDLPLLVRVVDRAERPVAGAEVTLLGGARDRRLAESTTTDERGEARFRTPEITTALVTATTPDGRSGMSRLGGRGVARKRTLEGGLVVVVEASGCLEGALTGQPAEVLERTRVRAHALTGDAPYHSVFGRALETAVHDGRYRFEALTPGRWALTIEDPGGARLVLPRMKWGSADVENSVDPVEVEVVSGRTVPCDLPVAVGGVLEGRVRRLDGRPVVGARVLTTFAPWTGNFPDGYVLHGANVWRYDSSGPAGGHPATHPETRTDADGRYRIPGMFPGRHRVEVQSPGLTYVRREKVFLADGEHVELEHVLQPSGALQGLDPERGYLGVTLEGEDEPRMIAVLPASGAFAFPGLQPGRWRLARFHSSTGIEPVSLVTVEVVAGRTTWVDLSAVERPFVLRGRVLGGGRPVVGAHVTLYPKVLVTDAEGRFETTRTFPWKGGRNGGRVVVQHEGIETTFRVPETVAGQASAEWRLALGDESLRVRVLDALGNATRASLQLDHDARGDEDGIEGVLVRDTPVDGAATFGGLAAGEYTALAQLEDGAQVEGSFVLPRADELVLRAAPSGDIAVLVRRPDGKPAIDFVVNASTWTGEGPRPDDPEHLEGHLAFRTTRTDSSGRAVLRGVRAGDVEVTSFPAGWLASAGPSGSTRVSLGACETIEVELDLREPPPR